MNTKTGYKILNGDNTSVLLDGGGSKSLSDFFEGLVGDTTSPIQITIGGTKKSISQANLRTYLGLGSNAYDSTSYLPLTGGTLTGALYTTSSPTDGLTAASIASSNIILNGKTTTDNWANAPRLTFDWKDKSATIGMGSDGKLRIISSTQSDSSNAIIVTSDNVGDYIGDGAYLPLSGGTLTGNLNMNDHAIIFEGSVGEHDGAYLTKSANQTLFINGRENVALEVDKDADPFIRKGSSTRVDYPILHTGNWSSYCAAASHNHPVNQLTWGGGVNLTPTATANNQEWSIDMTPGSYTGTFFQIWSDTKSTVASFHHDDGKVNIPYYLTVGNQITAGTYITAGTSLTASNGNITASAGLLKSTLNGNTVTIGSLNSSGCHIYNSADINFIFNKSVYTIGGLYPYDAAYAVGSSSNRWGTMYNSGINSTGKIEINGTDGGPYLTVNYNSRYDSDKSLDNYGINLIKFGMSSMDNYLGTGLNTNNSGYFKRYSYVFHTGSPYAFGWYSSGLTNLMELSGADGNLWVKGWVLSRYLHSRENLYVQGTSYFGRDSYGDTYYIDGPNYNGTAANATNATNADKLDGYHATNIDASFSTSHEQILDLRGLDVNTFYPCYRSVSTVYPLTTRIWSTLDRNDNAGNPSWATHSAGFVFHLVWEVTGQGWGTQSIQRKILNFTFDWVNQNPFGGMGLLPNGSIEYVYLRGGARYKYHCSDGGSFTLTTTTYTNNNLSISPKTGAASAWNYHIDSGFAASIIYSGGFYLDSDIRFKNIEKYLTIPVKKFAKLPLFDFTWNNGREGEYSGTSAQAVQKILPHLVTGETFLTLDYGALGTITGITACKELVNQKSEIDKLKERIRELELKLQNNNIY